MLVVQPGRLRLKAQAGIPQSKAQASLGSAKATALPLQVVRDQEYKPQAAPKPAALADSAVPRMEQTRPFERAAYPVQGMLQETPSVMSVADTPTHPVIDRVVP